MSFVNTYVSNIIFAFLQIKPDIPSDFAQGLTIFFIILFVSSIILASYILIRESMKTKNNIEHTIRGTSTITEISENTSTTLEESSSFSVSVTPPPDKMLSPSRLLLSIFKTVIVPVKPQSKVTPILAFPVSSSPGDPCRRP